jgi:CRP-like cAMP-binding protein
MNVVLLKKWIFFRPVQTRTLDQWVRGFTPVQRGEYRKGTLILCRGRRKYTDLCCLLEGEVSAEIQDYNGKVLKVETLKAYEAIATAVLFSPDSLLPVTVVAQTDVKTLWIPRKEILRLCSLSVEFLEKLLSDMGARLAFLAQKMRFLQFNTIRKKIADYLLGLMRDQRTHVLKIGLSRESLAEMFGVTRPALSRVFSELYREGILKLEGKRIEVLNPARLRKMAEEED